MKNKLLLILCILCSFLLPGCGRKEPDTLGESEYIIYYINTAMDTLVESRYTAVESSPDKLVEELMTELIDVPADVEALSALPDKVTYQGFNRDENILYLNFDTNYQSMTAVREIMARAALSKTLSQINGVEYINIRSGEQPLLDALGQSVGLISAGSFVNNISNVNSFEKTSLLLYFSDDTGTKLVPETREVFYDMNTSKERLIVDELIKGPMGGENLKATIPGETKVVSVTMNEGICYVNFDEGFLNVIPDVLDSITIYSIVDSLSELPGVTRVQILINGKSDNNYNTISLGTSVERNLDYLKEEN